MLRSWVGSGNDGSGCSCDADGGGQDPFASAVALARRSSRGPSLPKRRPCRLYHRAGRRLWCTIPRCQSHGIAARCVVQIGANFTAYQELKKQAHRFQPDLVDLPSYQHMIIGLISGAMGPFSNAPIDTIKTRLQKSSAAEGESAWTRITLIAREMWRQEGVRSFYKGLSPRVLRVAPGQAIVFAVYERVKTLVENMKETTTDDSYSE